jgi:hypothetical protein
MEIENVSQNSGPSGRTLVHFTEVVKEETSGQDSPRRDRDVMRIVEFRKVARCIGVDEPITLVSEINVDR